MIPDSYIFIIKVYQSLASELSDRPLDYTDHSNYVFYERGVCDESARR